MAGSTKEVGKKENNMVRANITARQERSKKVCGVTDRNRMSKNNIESGFWGSGS
jgi:hypothetical protein